MVKTRFLKGWSFKLTPMGNAVSLQESQKRAIDQKQMQTNSLTCDTNSQMRSTEPPKDSFKPCPSQKRPPSKPTLKSTSATPNTTSTENKAG